MENESKPMKTLWVNVYQKKAGLYAGFRLFETFHQAIFEPHLSRKYLCTCPIEIPDLEADRG